MEDDTTAIEIEFTAEDLVTRLSSTRLTLCDEATDRTASRADTHGRETTQLNAEGSDRTG